MRTVYRTFFQLADQRQPTLDAVRTTTIEWASTRQGVKIPKGLDLTGDSGNQKVGERCSFESVSYSGSHGVAWGLRLTTPDKEPDVSWTTETIVYENPDDCLWVSCSLQLGRKSDSLSPVVRSPSRPGIVERILSRFPGKGILPLTPNAFKCPAEQAPLLLRLLESSDRHHPVVFVSTTRDGTCLTNGDKLADHLCGLAYVIVGESAVVSDNLGQTLSDRLNCFDGGVRIYWPGFTRNSFPLDHPLWIRTKILALNAQHPARLGGEILNRIASVSVFTSSPSFVPWSRIAEWQRANAIEDAKANNNQAELLELFEQTNRDLELQVRQLREALEEKAQEATKYRVLADTFRLALESGDSAQATESLESGIETVADALAIAAKEFPSELAFCWNSKSEDADSPFESPAEVLAALRWLGTTYYDSRVGKKKCPDLEQSVRETIEGWSYEPHQSKGTMNHKKHWDWYHSYHNGTEHSLPEHLKCGSRKDARFSVRIAFTWDSSSRRVILGYLGQHQQNAAS